MENTPTSEASKRVSVWLWEEDYPHSLSEEELRTPVLVLQKAFNQFSLTDCQYLLWEWQHCHYRPFSFSCGEGLVTLLRFRKVLHKLLDVAWMITHDVNEGHLLRTCTEGKGIRVLENDYFIALKQQDLPNLFNTMKSVLSDGGGLQWLKNILYHWWGMGMSHQQLDDGMRTNPTDEIPQFGQFALMIEILYLIAMSLDVIPSENRFATSAYLSIQEGKKPLKTLMKIFSRWEYEELKEKLRNSYCLVDYGFEECSLSRQNGLIHTQHKIVALAALLAQKDDAYFEQPNAFTFKNEEVGSFWEPDHYIPFHHLNNVEYEHLITTLRCFDFYGLHRKLHNYVVFLVERTSTERNDEVLAAVDLFQELERLFETLYLFMLQRIHIES